MSMYCRHVPEPERIAGELDGDGDHAASRHWQPVQRVRQCDAAADAATADAIRPRRAAEIKVTALVDDARARDVALDARDYISGCEDGIARGMGQERETGEKRGGSG